MSGQLTNGRPALPGPFPPAFPARANPHKEMPRSSSLPPTSPSCSTQSRSGVVMRSRRPSGCGTDQVTSNQHQPQHQ